MVQRVVAILWPELYKLPDPCMATRRVLERKKQALAGARADHLGPAVHAARKRAWTARLLLTSQIGGSEYSSIAKLHIFGQTVAKRPEKHHHFSHFCIYPQAPPSLSSRRAAAASASCLPSCRLEQTRLHTRPVLCFGREEWKDPDLSNLTTATAQCYTVPLVGVRERVFARIK